jgi:hypothetical protein
MDDNVRTALFGVALPGLIALAGAVLGTWPLGRRPAWAEGVVDDALRPGALRAGVILPIAFAIAAAVCVRAVAGGPIFPPTESLHRLAVGAMLIAGTGLVGGLILPTLGPRTAGGWALGAALGAAAAAAVVVGPGVWSGDFPRREALDAATPERLRPALAGLGGLLVLKLAALWAAGAAWGVAGLAQRGLRVGACVVLVGLLVGVAVALAGNGSFRYGQLGAGAAAIAAGMVVVALLHRRAGVPGAGVACAAALGATLMVQGLLFNARFPLWLVLALGLVAPAALGVDALLARRGATGRTRTIAVITAAAAVALAAVGPGVLGLATWDKPGASDDPYSGH